MHVLSAARHAVLPPVCSTVHLNVLHFNFCAMPHCYVLPVLGVLLTSYVDKDDIFHVVKAVVAAQRDYGRRDNRKQARLKYLVAEWGVDRFR